MNFINLSKVCLKDNFPLSRIDQQVNNAYGHELLSLMDSFSGNQICMAHKDEEKTSFIKDEDAIWVENNRCDLSTHGQQSVQGPAREEFGSLHG